MAVPVAVVAGGSLAFRRRFPLVVVAVCFGALATDTWAGVPLSQPATPIAWIVISQYTVARHCAWRKSLIGLGLGLAIFATTLAKDSSDLVFGTIVILTPWVVGLAMRSRVSESIELAARASDLERRREDDAREAAVAERARIARDLHDVIAHSVSVMVVQAAAAAEVVRADPEQAAVALRHVQDTGRSALTEMGALLGILREHGDEIGMAPQPGLADLDGLVEQARLAGQIVQLRVDGRPVALSPGVELSIYRVVQEALTNTRKHSAAASSVVSIRYAADRVLVEITDDGTPVRGGYGGNHGIVGMRERVAVYGGTLNAGPAAAGGYVVHASMPLETA